MAVPDLTLLLVTQSLGPRGWDAASPTLLHFPSMPAVQELGRVGVGAPWGSAGYSKCALAV